ncbi:Cys-tRNA(Pro) deacylase [Muribaculaceae bacterium Isolate-037 (Harlan)]|jgi:Cys-tRNA(Pro)/Cys-tRNA(Cys) deacylase|uniref:Cys-tRNA(Pro) deacylase n=2 Tax=Lepagella muris TaxID=3032870 RepID=A0AC61RGV8_9BACT|nr:Cys-tRNA(Pro) deacylase [Muribaculaceae bacterium Isolate-037 (Harlan)]TGY79134.1 Cys-tRNA(Pro) deacylase [Lepagella muris]THG46798.1 Cys-tRNA(Pro) deacylase [Bacteroidales bacterium]TKC59439.1 Cys-tRNA(Pro) deacylase [Bacteroidales bacterium]
MSEKTNAARILDRLKIKYELVEYTVDPDNLAADHVAEELGEHIEQVYKTLVLRGDKTGIIVCVVAGNREVDLKKAAKASGNKKVEMIAMKELLPLTGYIRGGCTAIGMKKHYPTYISEEAQHFPFIYVSAGKRGLQLKLSPLDLAKAAQASFAEVATIE